jgi:CRISPR/Cas system-associated exonuclease Cas4 (RecB family)
MVTFVQSFCKHFAAAHPQQEWYLLDVVVPSQRIALHLKKELNQYVVGSAWLPNIRTINDFIGEYYPQKPMDGITTLFELYQSYCKVVSNAESFDQFLNWGNQIIGDFNDIDKYLLDDKQVFGNLKSIKEIESWSLNAETLTETQQRFLAFWEKLGEVYSQFKLDTNEKGWCTGAQMYRDLATEPYRYFASFKNKHVYFLAFNALSKSEELIFNYFVKSGQGTCFWDADEYYLKDVHQEAGLFIRQFQKWSGHQSVGISNALQGEAKFIQIYSAKSNLDQVNVVAKIIGENNNFNENNSAVVFADEGLLRPFLAAIPENIQQMNVAMGYPLRETYSFTLLDIIFKTLKSISRYKNKQYLYFKDFDQLFNNEMIRTFLLAKGIRLQSLIQEVKKFNFTYIPKSRIIESLKDQSALFSFLWYDEQRSAVEQLNHITQLFDEIRSVYLQHKKDSIELEALYKLNKDLTLTKTYLLRYPYISTTEGLRIITHQLLRSETIDFFGEPLQGLQVLGLLETRGLDFENVILVSCNEEVLPKSSFNDSLMPIDLRTFFGLPTKQQKDAIFAYYFYRLIQRAKNIHLVYNDGLTEKLNSTEKSRYLLQLEKEVCTSNPAIVLRNHQIDFERLSTTQVSAEKVIIKDEIYYQKLDAFLQGGISISAINTYLTCPKNFYIKYLLRIGDETEIEETIEVSTYGTIVHEVLQSLYQTAFPLLTVAAIDQMLADYESATNRVFNKYFPAGNYLEGKNYLQYMLALQTVRAFLNKEKSFVSDNGVISLIGLEQKFERVAEIETEKGIKQVTFKGVFDRVDKIGSKTRIIDYKTGIVEAKDLVVDTANLGKKHKVNQLLFYVYLMQGKDLNTPHLTSGIFSFKRMNQGLLNLRMDKEEIIDFDETLMEAYTYFLNEVVQSMYASENEVRHNVESPYCEYCN